MKIMLHDAGTGSINTSDTPDRPSTSEELAAQVQQLVAETIASDTKTDLDKIAKAIENLTILLGDTTEIGSIRSIIGLTGAAAGTATLREIKAKANADTTVNQLKATVAALSGLVIDLAQLVIDGDRAAHRTARQTQRLALLQTGTLTSADVGTDL